MKSIWRRLLRRFGLLLGTIVIGAIVISCGGGGGGHAVGGVGSGGTGTFSSGVITGFGSVVVNGVHYDENDATVLDESGDERSTSDLKLGMVVDIESGDVQTDSTTGRRYAKAKRIIYGSEIEGPLTAINGQELTVLGQTVVITASTVFDDDLRQGLASLKVGDHLEISGFFSTDGLYTATRIDREDDALRSYKIRGPVASVNAVDKTLTIGGIVIDYSAISTLPTPEVGRFYKINVSVTPDAQGRWIAVKIDDYATTAGNATGIADGVKAEIEGYVTSFVDRYHFAVNGVTVDATNARKLPSNLALGARVEVDGVFKDGVLYAQEVEYEDDVDQAFEVEGPISDLDTTLKTFSIRGVSVDYSGKIIYDDGTESMLRNGVFVEVKGYLSSTGNVLIAVEIEFDD